ncbi:alpha-N-arabinofuranosidase [Candidatus Latescibacterota bacterium]
MKIKNICSFRLFLITTIIVLIMILPSIHSFASENARIKIDIERTIGEIDKKIYGNFVEHLGRCIYGGIYEPSSQQADEDGFRTDVIDAVKRLNVTQLRWPGGNFVSGYHWEDGIGPRNERPRRIDLAWGAVESNQIGTDEFVSYCRKIGAEPYFCVNLGTGTWDEARNWVEYCNRESGTYYSDLRRANGNEKPHKVIYWGLGNEMDGHWQMGQRNKDEYAKYALEAAKMMKWIDPDIKLVASGSSYFSGERNGWIEWNRTVLEELRNHADYISLHTYIANKVVNYYDFLAAPMSVDKNIKITEALITEAMIGTDRETPIYIAFDEWNTWDPGRSAPQLEEIYNLQDALVVASFLNCFVRNAQVVKIANMAQLVNVIAPMFITDGKLWYQPTYYPLQLFANNCFGTSIETFVDCETYESGEFNDVPYLDVSTAYNEENGELIINVVNRHLENAIETEIMSQLGEFARNGVAFEVNGEDVKIKNSKDALNVETVEKEFRAGGESFTYTFPAHSYTMLKLKLDK